MSFLSKLFYNFNPHVGDVFKNENPFNNTLYKIIDIKGTWVQYLSGDEKGFYSWPTNSTPWSVFNCGKRRVEKEVWDTRYENKIAHPYLKDIQKGALNKVTYPKFKR